MSEKGSPLASRGGCPESPFASANPAAETPSRSWPATCYANGQQADEHNERIRGGSSSAEVVSRVTHTVTARCTHANLR